jgi:hypothetical protein
LNIVPREPLQEATNLFDGCACNYRLPTPDELDIVDGIVVHRDRPGGGSISLAEIARHLAPDSRTLGERDPGLTAEGWFRTEHMTYPYGVQIGVVRVDADTGQATVEGFLLAYDIGRSINPMLVEGQLVGGFVQGLGGALYEEFCYDERGQPLSVTLADYLHRAGFITSAPSRHWKIKCAPSTDFDRAAAGFSPDRCDGAGLGVQRTDGRANAWPGFL